MSGPAAVPKRFPLAALALVAALTIGPVAHAQSGGFLGGLFGGSDRFRGEEAEPERGQPVIRAQSSDADLFVRMERLENQIRQLTGTIEQLQFRNQQLEQQLRRSQEDIEYRFQELGGGKPGGGARPRASQPPPPPPSAAPPGRRSDAMDPRDDAGPAGPPRRRADVFDPREEPNAPGAPRPLGSPDSAAPPPIMAEEPDIGAPGGRHAGSPLDLSTLAERIARDPTLVPDGSATPAPPPQPSMAAPLPPPPRSNPNATGGQRMAAAPPTMAPTNSPKDELAMAQGYIQHRDYALGEEALREFLKKHPRDGLVADANYWLGESLYQQQRYRDAAESFLTVSTKYEKSGRAPEALLRLGQSLAAIGEREASCATFAEVVRKFPKATAVKQGAEREQKRGRC
jgi:tol-pal system protein YbgF